MVKQHNIIIYPEPRLELFSTQYHRQAFFLPPLKLNIRDLKKMIQNFAIKWFILNALCGNLPEEVLRIGHFYVPGPNPTQFFRSEQQTWEKNILQI